MLNVDIRNTEWWIDTEMKVIFTGNQKVSSGVIQFWQHFFFLDDEGRGELRIQLKADHHQPASETSFRYLDVDGPTSNTGWVVL